MLAWVVGSCALNVDTGENRLGLSMAEAVQLSARVRFLNHGITLLMSSMASSERADDPQSERQISLFSELRRLYRGIPACRLLAARLQGSALRGRVCALLAPRAEHPNTQARARRDVMFGCSDVYHWMGRTAKAVCLPDCGRLALKAHNLEA